MNDEQFEQRAASAAGEPISVGMVLRPILQEIQETMEQTETNQEPKIETEAQFLSSLQWTVDEDDDKLSYAHWEYRQGCFITVMKKDKLVVYSINNDDNDRITEESFREYIYTVSYKLFQAALDEIRAMTPEDYRTHFSQ